MYLPISILIPLFYLFEEAQIEDIGGVRDEGEEFLCMFFNFS